MKLIATGLVFAFVSVHINGFDLLVDAIGWGMCAVGAKRLGSGTERAAIAMVFLSLFALVWPVRPAGFVFLLTLGAMVTLWLLVGACLGDRTGGVVDVFRWLVAALGVLGALAASGFGASQAGLVSVAWFVSLVVLVILLYLLPEPVNVARGGWS